MELLAEMLRGNTHTRTIFIQSIQQHCTVLLLDPQHGMTSLCIFGPELLLTPLTALVAGSSSSPRLFSWLLQARVTFLCNNPSNKMPERLPVLFFYPALI